MLQVNANFHPKLNFSYKSFFFVAKTSILTSSVANLKSGIYGAGEFLSINLNFSKNFTLMSGLNFDKNFNSDNSVFTEIGHDLFIFWTELNSIGIHQLRAAIIDPVGNTYTFIDGAGINGLNYNPLMNAYTPSVTVFMNNPVVVWTEANNLNNNQIRISTYNLNTGREKLYEFLIF